MLKRLLFLLFFTGVVWEQAYAFDWIPMHEQAQTMVTDEAQMLIDQQELSPEPGYYLLGVVCLNARENEQAQRAFEQALALDPHNVAAQWGVAEVMRRKHDPLARQTLERLKKIWPDFYPIDISRIYLCYSNKDFKRSARIALSVIRARPETVDTVSRARAYLMYAASKGMLAHYGGPLAKMFSGSEVLPNIRRAQALLPDSAAVYFGLGTYYLLAPPNSGRDLALARQYLQKAAELDPLFADVYVRLAQVYRAQGDDQQYQRFLEKALEIDPQNSLALDIKSGKCDFICVEPEKKSQP